MNKLPMVLTILTKIPTTTATEPVRVRAYSIGGYYVTVNYEADDEQSHIRAAKALLKDLEWDDYELMTYSPLPTNTGYHYSFTLQSK